MICAVIKGPTYLAARQQIEQTLSYADVMELRLDCFESIHESSLRELQSIFSIPFIFTLRSLSQGGKFNRSEDMQIAYLYQLAALKPSYLDIESHLPFQVSQKIARLYPEIKLILSYHNLQETPANLNGLYEEMREKTAHFYKIAVYAATALDAMRLLVWSQINRESSLIVISMGIKGQISRILGPILHHPFTFACVEKESKDSWGQFTVKELVERYRYSKLTPATKIYGLIGDPIDLSISDETHNALFKELGLDAVYVKIPVRVEELSSFLELAKQLPIQGLSVTMPLKEFIVPFVSFKDKKAQKIGAVNTLCFQAHQVFGFNTDGKGALQALKAKCKVKARKILVMGAGGAAKAIVYEALQEKAQVTVVNRSFTKAQQLAVIFGCEAKALNEIKACVRVGYDILIHCSPAKMPIQPEEILSAAVIMDINTNPKETFFLKAALKKGCQVVFGYEMFIEQALGQFNYWFDSIDLDKCRKILKEKALICLSPKD